MVVPAALSLAAFGGLYPFLKVTFLGRAIAAVSQDREALRLIGVNPVRVKTVAFATCAGACRARRRRADHSSARRRLLGQYSYRSPLCHRHYGRPWLIAGDVDRRPAFRSHRGHDGDALWPLLVAGRRVRLLLAFWPSVRAACSEQRREYSGRGFGVPDQGGRDCARRARRARYRAERRVHNDYAFFLAYLDPQYAALALGWNILGGYAGFVNFGAAAFFAAGASSTVALTKTTARRSDLRRGRRAIGALSAWRWAR